mgnify:CR=1 FL=1|jgi:hypothetical protein
MISHGTYCRVEAAAGGVYASPRAMIRALRSKLTTGAKTRENREKRHAMINDMLRQQGDQLAMIRSHRL